MLAAKFEAILPNLDERQRRLVMGAQAGRERGVIITVHGRGTFRTQARLM